MADKRISELEAITGANTAADDFFLVVDTSGAVTKKISRAELNNAIEQDVLSVVDINGGTIDGTVIGGSSAAAGTFTTFTSTGIDDNAASTAVTIDSSGTVTFAGDVVAPDEMSYEVTTANLPASRPTLDFNFAQSDVIDPRIAITRASTASYYDDKGVLQTAAANVGRLDYDPSTLEPRGFLIEGAATNLLTYSEQFDNAAWSASGVTVTANQTVAPDGTTTADKILATSSVNNRVEQTPTFAATTQYTASAYVKNIDSGRIRLNADVFSADFLWSGASITSVIESGSPDGSGYRALNNDWYLIWMTFTTGGSPVNIWRLYPDRGTTDKAIYAWGAQAEAGPAPSSYIATTGSTATRAADVATVSDVSWLNAAQGTFIVRAEAPAAEGSNSRLLQLYNSADAASDRFSLRRHVTALRSFANNGGVNQWDISGGTWANSTVAGAALAFAANDISLVLEGTVLGADTSASIPSVDTMIIGASYLSDAHWGGWIRSITYYPQRLINAQLTALTEA